MNKMLCVLLCVIMLYSVMAFSVYGLKNEIPDCSDECLCDELYELFDNSEENQILSATCDSVFLYEGVSGYTRYNEYGEYFFYEYRSNLNFTIKMTDNTVIKARGGWIYHNDKSYQITTEDNQDSEPWSIGTHKVKFYVGDYAGEFDVTVESFDVKKITVAPITVMENLGGTLYGDYFYYGWTAGLNVKIEFNDGTIYSLENGNTINDRHVYIDCEDDQSNQNTWSIGIHNATFGIGTYEVPVTIEIVPNTINSIEVNPIDLIYHKDGNMLYSYDGVLPDGVDSFFYYDIFDKLQYKVNFNDGSSIEGTGATVEIQGFPYRLSAVTSQEFFDEEFDIGENRGTLTLGNFTCNIILNVIADNVTGAINYGDVNGDGKIKGNDVTSLLKYLAGWNVKVNAENSDCNGDGKIKGNDATLLLKYLAGWSVTLGI